MALAESILRAPKPDITLLLDSGGVIREATLSNAISDERVTEWLGRPWSETVVDVGENKVRSMVEDAQSIGVSAFREVTQRFPSGLELPIEYTAVRVGPDGGLIAIGKSLHAVAELQSRLVAAQQAMERDYWKLREVETRYRLLFDASEEAVVLVRASNLHIVEANPAAIRALGISPGDRAFLLELPAADRAPLEAMLRRVREHGRAPSILIHLGSDRTPWRVRASMMASQPGATFLIQLSAASIGKSPVETTPFVSVDGLIEKTPDGFAILDREGVVLRANGAFLELVQAGAEGHVVGKSMARWLGRPGADLTVLMSLAERQGQVRRFATTLHGELGTDIEVEISAAGDAEVDPMYYGLSIRDVSQRLPAATDGGDLGAILGSMTEQVGRSPLRKLVNNTVGIVERHYIDAALELTGGNRTAAAELLGLSRQSLYSKLNRYGIDGSSDSTLEQGS